MNQNLSQSNSAPDNQRAPLTNLLFNIILPVIILDQLSGRLGQRGPLIALILALLPPLSFGIFDMVKAGRTNWLSVLGVVNTLITGGFAVFHLEGIWFAVKEASFPFIIGSAVLITEWTPSPLVRTLLYNDKVLNTARIELGLRERQNEAKFANHLRVATLFLAASFFLSALLNYLLARHIFTAIPQHLEQAQRAEVLNQQISQMTWMGFVVIAAPSVVILFAILWYLVHGVRNLTGLKLEEILATPPQTAPHDPPS